MSQSGLFCWTQTQSIGFAIAYKARVRHESKYIYKQEKFLFWNMSEVVVSPFVSMLTTLLECSEVIYTGNEDDRTLRMLSCLVQSSKSLRDNISLKRVLGGLNSLHVMRTRARAVLEVHLRTPLLDNSVLDEFITSKPGSEMSRFHLLHAIRTHCAGIQYCWLTCTNTCFSLEYWMYLFEWFAYAQSNFKYEEFQNTHAPSRAAQWELHIIARQRHAEICFHLTGTGVYATMLTVCLRNARDRSLIHKFMDAVGSMPNNHSTVDSALIYVFQIPGNIVRFQTLIYNVCQQPCTTSEFDTTYSKYCMLTQKIFECVEYDDLSFSDSEQFEASKWMICNLEAMMHMTDDHYLEHRVQAAICTHMNLDTIGKLYQEGYIRRLCETSAQ